MGKRWRNGAWNLAAVLGALGCGGESRDDLACRPSAGVRCVAADAGGDAEAASGGIGGTPMGSGGRGSGGRLQGTGGIAIGGAIGAGGRAIGAGGGVAAGGSPGAGGRLGAGGLMGTGGSIAPYVCDPGSQSDPCQACIETRCCREYRGCVEDPDPTCLGTAGRDGELVCVHACLVEQVLANGSLLPDDLTACANVCAVGAVLSTTTEAAVNCILYGPPRAGESCSIECYGVAL